MKKHLILFITLFITLTFAQAQQTHKFSLSPANFLLDGKPFQIISGEMHPARIPFEYWRQRIKMAKAMGCNTIAAYVFWNYQETAPGIFDFKTGNHNIAEFIKICHEEGMWVLLRPGPYVCAEWDFGGIPTYLLKNADLKVRCMDPHYMQALTRYITRLAKEVAPLQCTHGGPILMVQVENEYGSYGNDRVYINTLKKLWLSSGINVPFYTADGPAAYMLDAGHVAGAAIGLDSGTGDGDFEAATMEDPLVPSFSSETYPGWLTHWGENWATVDTPGLKKDITYLLKNKKSFNLYVVHGGTNFGYSAGANAATSREYQPDVTSYDYDAPITEQGRTTPKFFMLRNLIKQYVNYKVPDVPAAIKTIVIPEIKMRLYTNIWQNLPQPIHSAQPKPFEALDQNQGMVLYRTYLIGHQSGELVINEPHDYAMVFLSGNYIDSVYRDGGKWTIKLPKTDVKEPVLDILVEGMGHINFGQYIIDRKGITDRVTLNGMTLMQWDMFKLPLDETFLTTLKVSNRPSHNNKGNFFKGEFTLKEKGDTYFNLSKYAKGVVFVNGHNLGRYWNRGPQHNLYCPAPWLRSGTNDIIVYDMKTSEAQSITTSRALR